jgi:hypothetical protein
MDRVLAYLAIVGGSLLTVMFIGKGVWALCKIMFDMSLTVLMPQNHTGEKWLISLSFWIPRKYREAISGDILEDCHEMRDLGLGEWRIRIHVLWQLTIGVIALWPEAIGSAVATIVKRVWSVKK